MRVKTAAGSRLTAYNSRRRATPDQATKQRVFDTATELFAEHGFKRVTVRQIASDARANVAAVNYHFGDKAGLYSAIVDNAIRIMRETGTLAREAGEGLEPRDQLRAFVHVFLTRVTGSGHLPWIHRLMTREMDDPTEMLARIMREVIEPRTQYLSGIIQALTQLPAEDPRLMRAVASIHGLLLIFGRPIPAKFPAAWKAVTADIDAVVEHITMFALGGLAAIAAQARGRGSA